MQISLNPTILSIQDSLKIGIIHYNKIVVSDSPQMIKGRMQLYQENLFFEMQEQPVTERTGIAEWRKVWKAFGSDPNRYRHSAESLMRRIAKQNYLTPIHSGVDLNNFFSLQYECPIGLYDAALIDGNVEITLGDAQTTFEGLNGRTNALNKILFSQDNLGPFGSPFVDSVRTAVTESTTEALHIFYLRPSLPLAECEKLLLTAGNMFTQVNGGDFEIALLSKEQQTISI